MRSVVAALVLLVVLGSCTGAPQGAELLSPAPTEEPAPADVPPEPDPGAELERVMELRSGWGLRSDEDWIRQVEGSPDSVMSELGIPVTPEEAEELAQMVRDEPRTRLIFYGAREHETFGGLWVNDPPFDVVMLFTRDLARHRAAVAALAPALRVDVRPARFTEEELRRLQNEIVDELRAGELAAGVEFLGLGLDTRNNVLTLDVKSNDPSLKNRLEQRYGGRLIANVHPLPGPWANVGAGDGWRLLAAGMSRGFAEAYRVAAATNQAEWETLWASIDPANPRPEMDSGSEIAVLFSHGIGSSCPELRLDEVVIDHDRAAVYSVASDPLAPRGCTADLAGAAYFVVALDRAALPASPFEVRLREDRIGGPQTSLEVDLRP